MKGNAKPNSTKILQKGRILSIVFLLTLFSLVGFFGYRYKHGVHHYPFIVSSIVRLGHLVATLKPNVQTSISKPKQIVPNQTPPSIHFEFYTALPSMQINLPPAPKNTLPLHRTKIVARAPTIISAEELEKEWSEEIKHHK